jgi:hypothetical protein
MKKSLLSSLLASVLFASSAAADPLYTVTALVGVEGSDEFHTLTGSFFLSDPQVSYNIYGDPDPNDAENLFQYDLSEFSFSSSLIAGDGGGRLQMKQRDAIDRYFRTSFGTFMHADVDGGPTWVQLMTPLDGTAPGGFRADTFLLRSDSGSTYRVRGLTASRAVPEPSSLMLMMVGLGGLAVRRFRQGKKR